MSIAEKLVAIAEKLQEIYSLKDKKPYIDTSKITDFRYFNQEGKRDWILPFLDTSNGTNFYYFCNCTSKGASALEVIPASLDFSKATQLGSAFRNCDVLHTIEYMDFSKIPHTTSTSNSVSGIFTNCSALVNITIKPNCLKAPISFAYSPLLSDESIDSIINCLATYDSGGKKLTLHLDVYNKLTEAQKTTIASKGWEVVSA